MKDLLVTDNGDLQINNGDFVVGNSELQHQKHIILAQKGEYKESPEIGVGIANSLNDSNPNEILTRIRANFEYDGMTVESLNISDDGTINVDATY